VTRAEPIIVTIRSPKGRVTEHPLLSLRRYRREAMHRAITAKRRASRRRNVQKRIHP
jgi:hypothetical protein